MKKFIIPGAVAAFLSAAAAVLAIIHRKKANQYERSGGV